jgi:hypothetical protein
MTLEMRIEGRVGGSEEVIALISIVQTENESSIRLSAEEE